MRTDKKEVNAIVLDVLQRGHPEDPRPVFKREAIVQAVGISQFKLLELVPKLLSIQIHQLVYIGEGEREKIERVKRRISYDELTQTAKVELPFVVEQGSPFLGMTPPPARRHPDGRPRALGRGTAATTGGWNEQEAEEAAVRHRPGRDRGRRPAVPGRSELALRPP